MPNPKLPKDKPVQVWFTEPVKNAMRALADKNARPLTREIEQAILAWLAKHGMMPE